MIVVTSVRTDIAIQVIEGGIFEPDQIAILKMAYDRAALALIKDYHLTDQAKAKLAKTVLRIGRVSVAAGRTLAIDPDVQNIASAASIHLLSLSADQANRLLAPVPLFHAARMNPVKPYRDTDLPETDGAFLKLVTNV
jgi:hypothetical protein